MPVVATLVAIVLAVIALLHLVWIFSPWPLANWADLARNVVGRSDGSLPRGFFVPATIAVVALLAAAAYLVAAAGDVLGTDLPPTLVTAGAAVVALVLLGRGVLGLIESGAGRGDAPPAYRRLDLAVYSPLCLVLGSFTATVALA